MRRGGWLVAMTVGAALVASGCAAVAGGMLLGGGYVAGKLSVKTRLTRRAVLQGSDGSLGLVVGIEAMRLHGPRPPLNAALVIDRSGSMSGVKIQHAKAAARQFIRALRRGDRITVVTYSNNARLVLPSTPLNDESQERALRAVDRIFARGMTNISGGLGLGRDQLLAYRGGGRVNRVILISDGIANMGITSPRRLAALAEDMRERDISVTTMGVGLQFNEDLLMRLADRGGGNYYYLRNARRLAGAFGREFGSMAGVVAKRPELHLELAPGVRVRSVPGYEFKQDGRHVRVKLSDLAGGARRKVVLSLAVPTEKAGKRSLARVRLRFRDARGTAQAIKSEVAAEVTSNAGQAYASVDKDAMREATQAEAASAMKRAITRYEGGDMGGAQATIRAVRRRIRAKAKRYHFSDDLIQGQLRGVYGGVQRKPSAAPASRHFLKSAKQKAQELAR